MGWGAIGSEVGTALLTKAPSRSAAASAEAKAEVSGYSPALGDHAELSAVLVRTLEDRGGAGKAPAPPAEAGVLFTADADAFLGREWDVCVEAAGQPAVRSYGRQVLAQGRTLLVTSIGALCDDALYRELQDTASASGGRLLLASGAMPGLDWMRSSSLGGPPDQSSVKVTQSKPPVSWAGARCSADGTPEPDAMDFSAVSTRTVVFEGSAREAATYFPKNANVSAAVALATCGLDNARVRYGMVLLAASPGWRFGSALAALASSFPCHHRCRLPMPLLLYYPSLLLSGLLLAKASSTASSSLSSSALPALCCPYSRRLVAVGVAPLSPVPVLHPYSQSLPSAPSSVVISLVADPTNFGTTVEYEGPAGKIKLEVEGRKSATNPRTSAVVPLSVIKAIENMSAPVGMGL